jgi:hypothetical protein
LIFWIYEIFHPPLVRTRRSFFSDFFGGSPNLNHFNSYPPPLSLSFPFLPLSYLFLPSYLPSVFILYFSPFLSLPLSHFATSIPRFSLSFLSFHPIPVFSLLVSTSESRHHFSFSCSPSLSPCVLRPFPSAHTLLLSSFCS